MDSSTGALSVWPRGNDAATRACSVAAASVSASVTRSTTAVARAPSSCSTGRIRRNFCPISTDLKYSGGYDLPVPSRCSGGRPGGRGRRCRRPGRFRGGRGQGDPGLRLDRGGPGGQPGPGGAAPARRPTGPEERRAHGGAPAPGVWFRAWTNVMTARTGRGGFLTLRVPTTRSFDGVVRLRVAATRKARAAATPARHLVVRADPRGQARCRRPRTSSARSSGWSTWPVRRLAPAAASTSAPPRRCASTTGSRRPPATTPSTWAAGPTSRTTPSTAVPSWTVCSPPATATPAPRTSPPATRPPPTWCRAGSSSPGHCANIMAPDAVDLGVGFADVPGSPYETYWVQDFGRG